LEKAKEEAEKYTNMAVDILDRFDDSIFLKELTCFLLDRRF